MTDIIGYHANLERGRLLRSSGRNVEARQFLGLAIQSQPDDPDAYLELALAESELPGREKHSLGAIDRAVALSSNSSSLHGWRAYLLSHFNRHPAALFSATESLQIDPACLVALLAQANSYTKLKRHVEAEITVRRMLSIDPGHTGALNLLAQSLRLQNRPRECRQVIAQILALTPNDSFGHANAGYEALKADDPVRAKEHFLESLRLDSKDDFARQGLLQSLRARMFIYAAGFNVVTNIPKVGTGGRVLFVVLNIATGGLVFGLCILYLLFAFTLQPLSNFFLLFNPMGWRALTRKERRRALLTGATATTLVAATAAARLEGLVLFFGGYLLLFALSVHLPQWIDVCRARREEKLVACATAR